MVRLADKNVSDDRNTHPHKCLTFFGTFYRTSSHIAIVHSEVLRLLSPQIPAFGLAHTDLRRPAGASITSSPSSLVVVDGHLRDSSNSASHGSAASFLDVPHISSRILG